MSRVGRKGVGEGCPASRSTHCADATKGVALSGAKVLAQPGSSNVGKGGWVTTIFP
jgi:hypothetical protein